MRIEVLDVPVQGALRFTFNVSGYRVEIEGSIYCLTPLSTGPNRPTQSQNCLEQVRGL